MTCLRSGQTTVTFTWRRIINRRLINRHLSVLIKYHCNIQHNTLLGTIVNCCQWMAAWGRISFSFSFYQVNRCLNNTISILYLWIITKSLYHVSSSLRNLCESAPEKVVGHCASSQPSEIIVKLFRYWLKGTLTFLLCRVSNKPKNWPNMRGSILSRRFSWHWKC